MMARWLARTSKFIVDFNGVKGSKMTLVNFATTQEVDVFRRQYLGSDHWPINLVGNYAEGSFGAIDEVYGNPPIVSIRLLDNPVPEEILTLRNKTDEETFPSNMFPNIIRLEHQIDIDPPME